MNNSVTGANITDVTSTYSLAATNFRLNDTTNNLVLSEVAQEFVKAGGIETQMNWTIYGFVNIPLGQYKTTYDTGNFVFVPSQW